MLTVSICVGSTCFMKGAKEVAAHFKALAEEHGLQEKLRLVGSFCSGNCQHPVCVTIGDAVFSVTPETADAFFEQEILRRIGEAAQ